MGIEYTRCHEDSEDLHGIFLSCSSLARILLQLVWWNREKRYLVIGNRCNGMGVLLRLDLP